MSVRLQTWFPFALYVYINGREWLARQMDQAGMRYQRHDNCFSWIEDFPRAQSLMQEQLKTDWSPGWLCRARSSAISGTVLELPDALLLDQLPERLGHGHRLPRSGATPAPVSAAPASGLRPEITINAPEQFRVFRHKSGDPDGEMAWRTLRRRIADLHRRAAVNRGEFAINGLRNRDLQALLFSAAPANQAERRRRSAAVSRKLRLLRAHGILHNLPHTHRYQVSDHGRLILNAVLSAQRSTTQQLTTLAA